jgi:hypothetical protein
MDTVTNTNTTSSEPVKSTTAPDKTKDTITSIKQESQNTNRTPSTAGKKKSSARNVDKKQIKNSATTFNEKAATQSKDLQESSHDQSEQDRIVVEDFEYGNTVDVDALERLLRNTKIENETSIDHPSDKSADKKDILEKPSPTLNNDLITENDSDRDVSDSEKEGQYVYQREIEKRQKKEIRDKEKAQKKAYTNEGSSHYQNPHIQYQQPQYNHSHSQYPQYEPHLYSQYSQYQYSQPEYPQSEYSQYQYPQYQYPQSQYPQSQYPQPQYPQPQYPEQYYNTYYGYHQHMTEKETEKQRKKRLRDLIKAGKKAQRTGIKEQASTYVDPKDQEELEKLEIHEDRKAEKKAQRKQERDVKKMEVSQDPAFVKLMMDIDE